MSASKRRRTMENSDDESTDLSNHEKEKFVEMLLKKHPKTKMQCDAHHVEIESLQDWNVLLEWLQMNDVATYDKVTAIPSVNEQNKIDELNRKKPNDRPINLNQSYVIKINANGQSFFMPDTDARSYALYLQKKLKFFHILSSVHGLVFFTLKVNLTPIENAVINWYFNHIYEGHIREPKSGGIKAKIFAMYYGFEEFNARPYPNVHGTRVWCHHHSDNNKCLAYIDYCSHDGQLKFRFNPHSGIERHCHSTASDWTDSDEDSEPETKPKVKAKRQAPAKLTDDDFNAEAVFVKSKNNIVNLAQPGTAYTYFKQAPNLTLKCYLWLCAQQNKTVGRCNAKAFVKEFDGKTKVAFTGTHNH